MFGLGAEVFVRRGRLMIRLWNPMPALFKGFVLHADDEKDPYVFRIDLSAYGMGSARVVFSRGPGAAITRVHLDLLPVSLEKRPSIGNPRLWLGWSEGALALAAGALVGQRSFRRLIKRR